jgi:glutathione peroxidase-family protein
MTSYLWKGLGKAQDALTRVTQGAEMRTAKQLFYDLVDKDMNGKEVPMSDFAGKVLLVVNVASKWGLTELNYTQLPQLSDEYGSRGLQILAFPCNQFGRQEPAEHEEILEFVKQYDEKMPEKLRFFEKNDVNGADAREVFSFLKMKLPNEDETVRISYMICTVYLLQLLTCYTLASSSDWCPVELCQVSHRLEWCSL